MEILSPKKLPSGETLKEVLILFFRTVELVQEPLAVDMDVKKVKATIFRSYIFLFRVSLSTSR